MKPTLTLKDRENIDRIHKETGYGHCKISKILNLSKWAVLGHLRGRTNGKGTGNYKHLKGDESPSWRGDSAGYSAVHLWARKNIPLTDVCQLCGNPGRLEHANISGEYIRDKNDFICVCKKCHIALDWYLHPRDKLGRLRKKNENSKGKTSEDMVK
jgi:hypothetical protein